MLRTSLATMRQALARLPRQVSWIPRIRRGELRARRAAWRHLRAAHATVPMPPCEALQRARSAHLHGTALRRSRLPVRPWQPRSDLATGFRRVGGADPPRRRAEDAVRERPSPGFAVPTSASTLRRRHLARRLASATADERLVSRSRVGGPVAPWKLGASQWIFRDSGSYPKGPISFLALDSAADRYEVHGSW